MAVPRPGPRFQFGADITKVKAAFLKISALLRENQRHYDRLGRAATRALAAFGIGAGAAIRQFARFETKMAQVNSLMSTTAEEAKALEDAAREMGATTQKSAGEAADALRYLALAGREPVEAIEALPAILDLSVGGMIDLGQASDIVTDGMSALGWEASRTAEFVDLLAQAQATSNATIGQFGEAFKKALPAGVGFNQTAQTIVATLGQLANAGLKAGEGGTLFRALTKSLVDNSAALAKYNIEVYNADGSTRDLIDIVEDFEAATRGLTDAQRDELLATLQNTRAISAMQIILTGGSAALRDYRDEVTDSAGAAKRLADIISDTLEGDFKKLTSAMSEAALVIGTETAPALRDFIRALTALITKFNKADKGAQGTIISLFGIGARFLAITALTAGVLKGLGAIAGAFLTLRRAAIAGAGGWRIFWGAAFAGLPIIVPLMVEAAIVISKNWDQVFSAIMEKIHKFTAEAKRTLARIYDLLPGGGGRAGALRASATESDRKAAIRGALSRAAAKRGGIDEFADKVAEAEKQLARRPATGAAGAPNPYNLGTGTDTGGAGAPAGHTPDRRPRRRLRLRRARRRRPPPRRRRLHERGIRATANRPVQRGTGAQKTAGGGSRRRGGTQARSRGGGGEAASGQTHRHARRRTQRPARADKDRQQTHLGAQQGAGDPRPHLVAGNASGGGIRADIGALSVPRRAGARRASRGGHPRAARRRARLDKELSVRRRHRTRDFGARQCPHPRGGGRAHPDPAAEPRPDLVSPPGRGGGGDIGGGAGSCGDHIKH